ncbi:MAG: hypothetical protein ABIG95_04075 [Candidatus Woesearchaeota archaeon]
MTEPLGQIVRTLYRATTTSTEPLFGSEDAARQWIMERLGQNYPPLSVPVYSTEGSSDRLTRVPFTGPLPEGYERVGAVVFIRVQQQGQISNEGYVRSYRDVEALSNNENPGQVTTASVEVLDLVSKL